MEKEIKKILELQRTFGAKADSELKAMTGYCLR